MKEDVAETKSCIQCAGTIPAKARLCAECGSAQDWRRFLTISSTMLALLVALISVSVPALNAAEKFSRQGSRIVVSNPLVHGQQISFVVTNLGLDPATLDGGLLVSDLPGWATLELSDPTQAFILPGSRTVTFKVRIRSDLKARKEVESRFFGSALAGAERPGGSVRVFGRNFDESAFEAKFEISGYRLFDIYNSFEEECVALGEKADVSSGCLGLADLRNGAS